MTKDELEGMVLNLNDDVTRLIAIVSGWESDGVDEEEDQSWLRSERDAGIAADYLTDAFDWDECPFQPASFGDWGSLVVWLKNLEEE